jgi:cell division protein FtsW
MSIIGLEENKYDVGLIIALATLIGIGIIMIFIEIAVFSAKHYGSEYYVFAKHILFVGIGVIGMIYCILIDYEKLRKISYILLLVTFMLLILALVGPLGIKLGGSRRWVSLFGFVFQPSELAKLSLIIYLAHSISKRGEKIKTFSFGFAPNILISGILLGLILLEPDFGTTATLGAIVFLMLFVGGVRLSYIVAVVFSFIPLAYFLVMNVDYRRKRIMSFLNPWEDPLHSGFQIIQSFIAIHSGGSLGLGLGEGKQKLFYLPQAHTDFIFSHISEEMGIMGAFIILFLFFIIFIKGMMLSCKLRDPFARLMCFGLTMIMTLQSLIHIAVVIGLVPTKGLTLPFISYGGSSLVMSMCAAGILINLSRNGEYR